MTRHELLTSTINAYLGETSIHDYPLYKCSASIRPSVIVDDRTGVVYNVYILKSYSTIVAVYVLEVGILFVFDYWSTTTSQHCRKFEKWLREYGIDFIQRVDLYWRSDRKIGLGYKINREIYENDFGEILDEVFS